jgi:hypothetical protein
MHIAIIHGRAATWVPTFVGMTFVAADCASTRYLKWLSQVCTIVPSGIVIQHRDDS